MSHAEITMKSGAVITFDCTELTVGKSPLGGMQRLKWTTPEGAVRSAMHVDVEEIAAVIFVQDTAGEAA